MGEPNMRTLSLVVGTFTYLLVGAAVFDALESETESQQWEFLLDMKNSMMEKYNISPEDYKMLEVAIIENKPYKSGPQWKFSGSFYFATVVLATIGYGHSTPVTAGGKAFCIVYAMIGIPLGLVMFQSIGERLNKFAFLVIRKMKTLMGCKKKEVTQMNLMSATALLSSIIIFSGAAVFSKYERWSYLDSFYYCFVTLTTIGFGDYVALQNDHSLTQNPGYVVFSLIFVLFGLAVVAASINLLVLRFMTIDTDDNRGDEMEDDINTNIISDDDIGYTINGNLLAERLISAGNEDSDQVSVCSCSCFDLKSHRYNNNHNEGLLPMNIIYRTRSPILSPRRHRVIENLAL